MKKKKRNTGNLKIHISTKSASRKKVLSALRRAKRSFEIIEVEVFLINFSLISENWDCNHFQIKTWIYLYERKMKIARNKPLFLELLSFQYKWPFCGNWNGRSLPRISPFLREADVIMLFLSEATWLADNMLTNAF